MRRVDMSVDGERRKYPLVLVEWLDASARAGWTDLADAKDCPLAPCMSVGFLIHKDKDRLVVVATVGTYAMGDRIAIPKPWVTKIEYLGVEND